MAAGFETTKLVPSGRLSQVFDHYTKPPLFRRNAWKGITAYGLWFLVALFGRDRDIGEGLVGLEV